MSTQATGKPVTASPVGDSERMDFLPNFFGRHMMRGEAAVYSWASMLSVDYQGGTWAFYRLSNGGFYMAPTSPDKFRVECAGNGFNGVLSADATGVVVTLFALCHLAEIVQEDRIIDHYHALREFALDHPEALQIFRAID
jgi:Antirestriction protein